MLSKVSMEVAMKFVCYLQIDEPLNQVAGRIRRGSVCTSVDQREDLY